MDAAMVDLIIRFISGVGFPVFVAVWLLVRTDRFIQENTRVTEELKQLVELLRTELRR